MDGTSWYTHIEHADGVAPSGVVTRRDDKNNKEMKLDFD